MKRILLYTYVICIFFPSVCWAETPILYTLRIHSGETEHRFLVAVAETPEQKRTGLMFRESMPEEEGMLFRFNPPKIPGMWMKNTLIPLDMLFIKADGTIAYIAENTVPKTLDIIRPSEVVSYVLELNGGICKKLGINVNDQVVLPLDR